MPEDMTVMIVDGGARGHVLSEAYENDPRVRRIIVAPGNDFIGHNREKEFIIAKDCSLKDPNSLLAAAKKHKPDLVDVAQDDALALGTVDLFLKEGFGLTFGATQKASRIEWDKEWSREFMHHYDIPSPRSRGYGPDTLHEAEADLRARYAENPDAWVFEKAFGLCGGKGALDSRNLEQGFANIQRLRTFGPAGERFVIEDGMVGEEFSYVVISDGKTYRGFKPAQDNKLSHNFDLGEQTGGMGANAPALVALPLLDETEKRIIRPTIKGMHEEEADYLGILYLGAMHVDGHPKVVEFNARPPDPEAQVIWPGISNYPELVLAAIQGRLHEVGVVQDNMYRWCVVGAARGYPNSKEAAKVKGKRIYGLEEAKHIGGVSIYGAGIDVVDGKFYANGGRLFSVVAKGRTPEDARQRAYQAMSYISVEGNNLHFRSDIGWRDMDRSLMARN